MTVTAVLIGYAILVAHATRLLCRPWIARAPRLAIMLWQLALGTVVGATVLGLLALTVPVAARHGLAALIRACVMALSAVYRSPSSDLLVFLLGIGLTGALVLRLGGCFARGFWRANRDRRRHLQILTLLGVSDRSGATVVDHAGHVAYCVPGRQQRIVISTATLAALDAEQLDGVLAHERAHLAGRHDVILGSARALARAVPLPVFTRAAQELATLVEMVADDAARSSAERRTLASALVRIATGDAASPVVGLAAATTGVLARIDRLVRPVRPLSRPLRLAVQVAGLVAATVPVLLAVAPAALATTLPYCPVLPH